MTLLCWQIILYINAEKKISEGIDDLQVPKTYEKPLNCVIFLDVYFDD